MLVLYVSFDGGCMYGLSAVNLQKGEIKFAATFNILVQGCN